ncbi:MAG: tRNA (adenosine(37)-N6)-threonylcarbamoyltransferase complex transferase subunit TsaD [Simkaniaceae bacterium]|nr:tRNA (adenosine(37)-N6)-threonylcarbamoyltransferase complex transferase subunit TsaD [Simkaniaceae bacterium]
MFVLGIESSCDETAAAVVKDGQEILSNIILSQTDLHKNYGGVFPELACRRHLDFMLPVIQEALDVAGVEPDLIAVTQGPGLIGALIMGINAGGGLSMGWDIPLVGVNHVDAHVYAASMGEEIEYPALGIVVSGGHTAMMLMQSPLEYEILGKTVDDAIGESFDKVARMLDLPYPGGPEVEKLAKNGDPKQFDFKPCRVKGRPMDFSFSGLKTKALYAIKGPGGHPDGPNIISEAQKKDVAAAFQLAAIESIVYKGIEAAVNHGCRHLLLGGGVSNNALLRELFVSQAPPTLSLHFPKKGLCLDNAAMIAGLGYHVYQNEGAHEIGLAPLPKTMI